MKLIKLTQGKFAIVDDVDFEWISQWRWGFDGRYARRREDGIKIYMHIIINNTPSGRQTDHINRNKLDNRKFNLRVATPTLNLRNTGLRKTNISGYKGIYWWKERNKWQVYIWKNYKKIHLGLFKNIEDAVNARKRGEEIYWV